MREAREFAQRFGQPEATYLTPRSADATRQRLRFIKEEYEEVIVELRKLIALESRPGASFADAVPVMLDLAKELADLKYVIEGTAVTFGIDLDRAYAEVHRSNMTKTPASDGGKATKGPGYSPANIELALGCPVITVDPEEDSS